MTDCTVLVLNEACLEKAFDSAPKMRFVLDCLVGEDVAKKLYAVSDVVNMSVANQRENQKPGTKNFSEMKQKRNLDFRRTASMDAIHTGGINRNSVVHSGFKKFGNLSFINQFSKKK